MVTVQRAKLRRTRRSTRDSAENTPVRNQSSPTLPNPSPIQTNFSSDSRSRIPPPQFNFTDVNCSPFVLTNGDNPGNAIITEVLDGSNYSTWKIAMFVALDAKNKIVFVDGSLPRPPEFDPSFRVWSRCNGMVKSWILNSVTKEIYKSILRFDDAAAIWKDLMTRFHITNLPRTYQIMQQIWSLQQGTMSLSEYYTSLKTLWDNLEGADCTGTCRTCKCCKANVTRDDHAKTVKFLSGLNESYATIRSQIIMKKPIPDLAEIYNLLDQDHSQRNITTLPNNVSTFNVAASVDQTILARIKCNVLKHKQKSVSSNEKVKPVVASLALTDGKQKVSTGIGPDGIAELVGNMSKSQIQDVIAYFSTQLHSSAQPVTIASVASSSDINGSAFDGSYQGADDWKR